MMYAWGDDVSATASAKAMKMAGCVYGMHLDMNPHHTGFMFTTSRVQGTPVQGELLTKEMEIADRPLHPVRAQGLLLHDGARPEAARRRWGAPWVADGGSQPPPHWLPGVCRRRSTGRRGRVELLDVEASRARWAVRAGALESPAAAPLRELTGDDSKRVLFAVRAGVAPEKHPAGLATAGRLVVPVRGDAESGVLLVGGDGRLSILRSSDAPSVDPARGDLLELPLAAWDGKVRSVAAGSVEARAAIGMTPQGRVLVARGVFPSVAPLADALVRAGCTRALVLDRGTRASASIDRAGTASPARPLRRDRRLRHRQPAARPRLPLRGRQPRRAEPQAVTLP